MFSVFTKFGALFLTIPDPVIGGTFFVLFGMSIVVSLLTFYSILTHHCAKASTRCVTFWVVPLMYDIDDWGSGGGEGGGSVFAVVVGDVL